MTDNTAQPASDRAKDTAEKAGDLAKDTAAKAGDVVEDTVDKAGNLVEDTADKADDLVEDARTKAAELAAQARDAVEETVANAKAAWHDLDKEPTITSVRDFADDAVDKLSAAYKRNPARVIAVGTAALAAAAILSGLFSKRR